MIPHVPTWRQEVSHTRLAGCKKPHLTSHRFTVTDLIHGFLCVICTDYHPAHIPSVSVKAPPTFLLLINVMDCESKVNDFPLTTEDALALTIRHHLQSILPTEITASIIAGDTHKTTGTPAGRWMIQTGASAVPQVHKFPLKETLKAAIRSRWTRQHVYQYPTYSRKAHFR